MELSGEERQQLRTAILSAYPTTSALEIMVSDELNLDLETIANINEPLEKIVFQLIKWIYAHGRIEDFIKKSHQRNPNNQQLKDVRNRLIPKFSNHVVTSSISSISNQQWKELNYILSEIDLDLISKVCRLTLENIDKNKDVLGNYPEILEMRSLSPLKSIFLEKCPFNSQKKPTVLEFAERLAQEDSIEESSRNELNQWINILAEELHIELPTYDIAFDNESSMTLQSYLLITVSPVGSNTFRLVAELIPNFQDFANQKQEGNRCLIPIELSKGEVGLECSLTEVPDAVYKFINASRINYLSQCEDYDLTVELFLPLPYLGSRIDLEDIPIGFDNRREPIGNEYRFVVRSLDRITVNGGEYRMRLSKRWKKITKFLQTSTHEELKNYFECLSTIDRTWNALAVALQDKFVLNVKCGLPESDKEKEELFIAMLRGGIPITLWTKCNNFADLDDINIENELDKILTKESLTEPGCLFEQVWRLRQKVYYRKEKCLDYHIGFLCDHPNRLPFHLKPENQQFWETGL